MGGQQGGNNRRPPNGRYVDQTRINERVRWPKVRVVDGITHQQYGVLVTSVALRLARERGLDSWKSPPPPIRQCAKLCRSANTVTRWRSRRRKPTSIRRAAR